MSNETTSVKTVLSGHVSPETAYLVEDYPYGFRLRCKIRYWMEHDIKKGSRFCSQTTDPRRSFEHWNAPKKSTYSKFGGAMYLDQQNHVEWTGVSEYTDLKQLVTWREQFGPSLPVFAKALLDLWTGKKLRYEIAKRDGKVTWNTGEVLAASYPVDDPIYQTVL